MRQFFLSVLIAVFGFGLVAEEADARRLGGGGSAGLKRSVPVQRAPEQGTPPQQSAQQPAQAAAATPGRTAPAAQTAPRRSWLGPIAGLAAGLGIAALFSHFGLGGALANAVTLALLVVLAVVVLRFLLRRLSPAREMAGAGAAGRHARIEPRAEPTARTLESAAFGGARPAPLPQHHVSLPPNFDLAGFERAAKLIFIRMQAANDAADLDDLRRFTTPEMFAAARLDLQERRSAPQRTDVMQLDAEVMDLAREEGRDIVSVRYHGLIREEADSAAQPFDEVWHLVRPADGSADWALAGIAQNA